MKSVRQSGTIVKWNDEKGFGFIAPDAGAGDVYAHVKAIVGARRPTVGDRVFFFPGKDNQGRSRAFQVQFENASSGRWWSPLVLAVVFSTAFLAALALASWLGRITPVVPVVYVLMTAVAFGAYWHDKASARHGAHRLPENALHLLELFGGWPGALVAQQWLRHKNRKLSYQVFFWGIVAAHLGAWIYFAPRK